MTFRMNLTWSENAPLRAYERRDEIASAKGRKLNNSDLFNDLAISRILAESVQGAAGRLDRVAAKAGFKASADGDVQFGIHGAGDGPLEFWFQKVFVA